MWFKTTTTQLETLATQQEKLEKQTQERFKTILLELSKMCRDMQNYNDPDKYGEYGNPDQAFSLNNMDEDKSTQYTKSLLYRAANNSHMEDVGMAKWQNTTGVETIEISGIPISQYKQTWTMTTQ